ncbi:MAG: methyltransferase domain-containing protein [Anaerobiospirillum succiniciproducens]|uniref:methyltransferase domain-containing protein n=1 Tax=Anaerobiospirillum succiniciproducens TaxID=13335 RepID=UPI002A75C437|nr:methyltransferase domain-containing protein [Anaerobiospirillum succiniciproducens]MDY2797733.1 methyltransferase domain-containing protein [Anaerobiospirillum succiniciproducens]
MDKRRVLVLNCDSFAAVTEEDSCARAGFKVNDEPMLFRDYRDGPRYNRFMSLPAMLSEHVLFNAADTLDIRFGVTGDSASELSEPSAQRISDDDISFLSSFKFYSLPEFGAFNADFVKQNFDAIFYFMHGEFTYKSAFNEELCSLLLANSKLSSFIFIFNFKVSKELLNDILNDEFLLQSLDKSRDSNNEHMSADFAGAKSFSLRAAAFTLCKVLSQAQAICMLNEDHGKESVYASANDLQAFFAKLKELSVVNREPHILSAHNGYLNFRSYEAARAMIGTSALIEHILSYESVAPASSNHSAHGNAQTDYSAIACNTRPSLPSNYQDVDNASAQITFSAGAMQANTTRMVSKDNDLSKRASFLHRDPIVVISSELFTKHPLFELSPLASRLICKVMDVFPNSTIKLLLNDSAYTFFNASDDIAAATAFASNLFAMEKDRKDLVFAEAFKEIQSVNQHRYSDAQLSSLWCDRINASLDKNIKRDLFLKHGGDPFVDEISAFYAQREDVSSEFKLYCDPIKQCLLIRDYDEFIHEDFDVLISDSFYEQMLALSAGKAVFGLKNDFDPALEADLNYFALSKDHVPASDDEREVLLNEYAHLKRAGLMRLVLSVGGYKKATSGSFGIDDFVCQLSLKTLIDNGLSESLHEFKSKWDVTKLQQRLDAYYHCKIEFIKTLKAAFDKGDQSLTDNSLTKGDHEHDADSANASLVDKLHTAQLSNFTEANRYQLQWMFLSYFARFKQFKQYGKSDFSNANVLSFGCSRGREACDLVTYFHGSKILGVDINPDAICRALQMRDNLCVGSNDASGMQKVEVYGKQAYMDFKTTDEFFHAVDQNDSTRKFDVVTVMTVLCRHPATVNVLNSKAIYSFEEFESSLMLIDSLVKVGGLLCLFNGNYDLQDTAIAERYIPLFPFDDLMFTVMSTKRNSQDGSYDDVDMAMVEEVIKYMTKLHHQELSLSEDHVVHLPLVLKEQYQMSSPMDKYGYVTLFDAECMRKPMRMCSTIFMKVCD